MTDYGYGESELPWGAAANITEADIRGSMQVIKDLGGSRIRMSVQLGTLDEIDRTVLLAREYGLKPLLVLINNPNLGYVSTPESFGTMCKTVATRYGPLGVGALQNTCSDYQLMNESNLVWNPPNGADPETFTKYLKAGFTAITSVHSSAKVITGGTTAGGWFSMEPLEWYRRILAAGGGQFFHAVGMHLYVAGDPALDSPVWKSILDVRALLVANGLSATQIWVTEVGVAFPFPGVTDLVNARDRLKTMVDGILSQAGMGPFYIYNVRCYTGGDGIGGNFGMVNNDFTHREPIYSYAKTIAGTPADPLDIIPPSNPTGLTYSDIGTNTLKLSWVRNPTIDGVTNYRIYSGSLRVGDTIEVYFHPVGLTPGAEQSLYVTAVDAAGNESGPSNVVKPTTLAPSGSHSQSQGTFTGSTVPTTFNQLGLGVYVSSGVALPNPPTTDDQYVTVWPRVEQQRSPDHSFRISLSAKSNGSDRSAGSVVRMSADGTQGVAAFAPGGGVTDALTVSMLQGGKVIPMAGKNVTPGKAADDLLITVTGNVYVAQLIGPGEVILAEVTWVDVKGVFAGSSNLGVGMCWLHRRVGGVYYAPPGVTKWAASDVGSVAPVSTNDWAYAVVPRRKRARLIASGSWEPFI